MLGKAQKVILGIILFVGAVLRIYNYWDFSLSNDELSALARLNFDSFSDLIQHGVRIDGHPAAAQVILWYITKWFGNSVAVVRFPFVVAGILSIYFMFKLAREWVSVSAGLLSTAVYATLSFPILYSRIARPYALGMLFALMAAYFWIRIVKDRQQFSDYIWMAVSMALCAYSHFFAGLVAAILALVGIFLISGKNLKIYLFALVGALVLYLPYIPIFLHQLSLGGVGQWLGPPENDWLLQHVEYIFNDSILVLILVLLTGIIGYFMFRPKTPFVRAGLPLLLFIAPFLVGFSYSKWVNPVLQNSTLLFSFPFLLVFIFSGWEDGRIRPTNVFTVILLVVTLFSTVVEKRFYRTNYFGVFKELAEHVSDWYAEVDGNAILIGDYNLPFYIHYYLDELDSVDMRMYRVTDENGLADLKSIVDTSTESYLIYSWSTRNQIPEVEAIIKHKFPDELKRRTYFNSEAVMFTRGELSVSDKKFEFHKTEEWDLNPEKVKEDSTGWKCIVIDDESPYGPTFIADIGELDREGIQAMLINVELPDVSTLGSAQLVYEQVNESGGYSWESDLLARQFKTDSPKWGVFYYGLNLQADTLGKLKIYPWSPDGEAFELSKMEITFLKGGDR